MRYSTIWPIYYVTRHLLLQEIFFCCERCQYCFCLLLCIHSQIKTSSLALNSIPYFPWNLIFTCIAYDRVLYKNAIYIILVKVKGYRSVPSVKCLNGQFEHFSAWARHFKFWFHDTDCYGNSTQKKVVWFFCFTSNGKQDNMTIHRYILNFIDF